MKKACILMMILMLLFCAVNAAAAEAPDETDIPAEETGEETVTPVGDWYGEWYGLPLQWSFREDGTYALMIDGKPESAQEGAWQEADGFVILDGNDLEPLSLDGGVLSHRKMGLYLTREQESLHYIPAGIDAEADPSAFAGAWRSVCRLVKGVPVFDTRMQEDTRLYVEEARMALTGSRFGEQILDGVFESGAFTFAPEGGAILLQMQQDGFMRMTVSADGEEIVLLLAPFYPEAFYPEEEQTAE